jgi:cytochrome d ubiquinol oxidase subunit I
MNVAAFAVVVARERVSEHADGIRSLDGLGRASPWLATAMTVAMLALAWLAGHAVLGEVPLSAPLLLPWWVLALGFAATETWVFYLQINRESRTLSLSELPLVLGLLCAAPVQLLVGDWIARRVTEDQPTKLAAIEGLGPTTKGPAIHILGWYENGRVKYGIEIPQALSLLAKHKLNATIRGLEAVQARDRPPVNVVRVAFQTMVGIGTLLALLGVVHLVTWFRRRRFVESRWFLWGVVAAGPLSLVALIAGWVTTEVGRQPWVVYGVMRTSAAVTGAGGIPVGYATLVVVYIALGFAVAWILTRLARRPLDVSAQPPPILETHGTR